MRGQSLLHIWHRYPERTHYSANVCKKRVNALARGVCVCTSEWNTESNNSPMQAVFFQSLKALSSLAWRIKWNPMISVGLHSENYRSGGTFNVAKDNLLVLDRENGLVVLVRVVRKRFHKYVDHSGEVLHIRHLQEYEYKDSLIFNQSTLKLARPTQSLY